jgi:hypothetical protein
MQLHLIQPPSWEEPMFGIRSDSGRFKSFVNKSTNINKVREESRAYGDPLERIDLWNKDTECSNCCDQITGRFSANSQGDILCWDCAMNADAENDQRGVSQTTDPTKAVRSWIAVQSNS